MDLTPQVPRGDAIHRSGALALVCHNAEGRMGVELRRGRPYLYHRRRAGGRVRVTYAGPLTSAEVVYFRGRAESGRADREFARREVADAAGRAAAVVAALDPFDQLCDRTVRAGLHLLGFRLHRRGEWRRTRGGSPMADLEALLDPFLPRPGLMASAPLRDADRDLLARAAAGDRSTLTAVRELLADPGYARMLGSASAVAAAGLAVLAGGSDVAVQEGVLAKIRQHVGELVADVPAPVPFAVRMAATRAAHAWLAVHLLEAAVTRRGIGTPGALAVERQLAVAERRLAAALKSLAVLKRLARPAVAAQVNVARRMTVVNAPTT